MARELDDAILLLRTNELDIGTWVLKTRARPRTCSLRTRRSLRHQSHWFVRETIGMLRRTLARLDVTSRTLFALIEPGSCFAGTLARAGARRRSQLHARAPDDDATAAPKIALSEQNFGALPDGERPAAPRRALLRRDRADRRARSRRSASRSTAERRSTWASSPPRPTSSTGPTKCAIALEERASLSPDALTGMEANLRFGGAETMETRVFGRLSAWQNWIFIRPNAVGEAGALKVYGTGNKARFDWHRV